MDVQITAIIKISGSLNGNVNDMSNTVWFDVFGE